jgi:copper transport protein
MAGMRLRLALLLPVLACALAIVPSAWGHAILSATEPGNDTVIATSPGRVTLTFNEPVETAFGAVRVYNAEIQRVDEGRVSRPDEKRVAVALPATLPAGTYTVTWRVISADAHPIHGAFVFSVVQPTGDGRGVASLVRDDDTPGSVLALQDAVRAVGFGLLLLVAGGIAALVGIVPRTARGASRLWRGITWAALVLALCGAAGIVLQGAAAGGFGIGDALDGDVIAAVLETRFGKVWLAQAAAASAIGFLALVAYRHAWARFGALVLAGWLVVSPGSAGHAQATGAFSFALDVVHVAAAAVWIGGLAAVVVAVVLERDGRAALAARVVPRFSTVALGAVAALLVTGVINGYLQVRAWHGLWETRYGVLLLVKSGLVLGLIGLGAANRLRSARRLRAAADAGATAPTRTFTRIAALELAVAAGVVAVTALLVAAPPARVVVAPAGLISVTSPIGPLELNLTLDPAQVGSNAVHVYLLDSSGRPAEADEAVIKASLPSAAVGPLEFKGTIAGPGHFQFIGTRLALPGRWSLRVEVRRGEFEQLTATVTVPVRRAG